MWNFLRRRKLIPFADDAKMRQLEPLAEQFYRDVLEEGDEPAFVSDEANVFDVSSSDPEYLLTRIASVYGKQVTLSELKQPFWRLLLNLSGNDASALPAIGEK